MTSVDRVHDPIAVASLESHHLNGDHVVVDLRLIVEAPAAAKDRVAAPVWHVRDDAPATNGVGGWARGPVPVDPQLDFSAPLVAPDGRVVLVEG